MSRIIRTRPSSTISAAVEYHGFVFTQGLVSRTSTLDFRGQTLDILQQADELLETHGTDNTRLLQAQIWLKTMSDRPALNEIWEAWLPDEQAPARAVVQANLANPAWLIEIMLIVCK